MSGAPVTCAIHQPNLFPRLSTLAKLFAADVWVVLDDVQFTRRDYQHRARLRPLDPHRDDQWMIAPVHLPHGRSTIIRDVTIADPLATRTRISRMTEQHYARSAHWPALQTGPLRDVVCAIDCGEPLASIAETSTAAILAILEWPGAVYHSSSFRVRSDRNLRLVDLVQAVGADTYLCGTGGARYLHHGAFDNAGLTVTHVAVPPEHGGGQIWTDAHRISALYALMEAGPHDVSAVLRTYTAAVRSPQEAAHLVP